MGRRGRRIGLALAGGGPGGAVYEIGALRALEESLEGLDLNDLDVYVGVSAGSFVAASLANGITSSQMVRAMVKHEPGEHPFLPRMFFTPDYGEWARRGLQLPGLAARALRDMLDPAAEQTLLESLVRLFRALPVGLFDSEPLRRYLRHTFAIKGRTDDFRRLERKLVVVATDLGTGEAIRFGEAEWAHVPISTAVTASCALPGIYAPLRVDGRDCVDGVLLKTLHASVALENGAGLLLCVNPIVPADLSKGDRPGRAGSARITPRGLSTVLSQTFRTLIHSRLRAGMSAYKRRFPDADVLLFEPARDEYRMFFTNIFSFASRRKVCELAYASTRRHLLERRAELEPALERAGIRMRIGRLEDGGRTVWESAGLLERDRAPVSAKLHRALAALEGTA